ncbi:MAG TPA: sulfotransferase [Luteimonas sp.]|nr:sulfotransferase [Luteimonas sp.]
MELEAERARARAFEAAGDLGAAARVYRVLVESDPSQLDIWLRLSALEQVRGRYREAVACARSAATALLATARWPKLLQVSRRLLGFDEIDAMQALLRGADWNHMDVLAQAAALSQQLWLTHAFDDALRLIDMASSSTRPAPALLYSKALALAHSGHADQAEAAFEACLAVDPDHPDAHWSLAHHRRSPAPLARVDRIRRARAAFGPAAIEQAYLCNALFKEFDDAGDTGAAWEALVEGNAIKRALVRHDDGAAMRALDATIEHFGRETIMPTAPTPHVHAGEPRPLFIVGMPRTGTTVLERMLGRHTAIASAGELNAFAAALCIGTDAFLPMPPTAEAVERLRVADHHAIGRDYLRRTRALYRGHPVLVDKNPLNVFAAGCAARALPGARFLCLVRDPMDACFSNYKALFAGSTYAYSYVFDELAAHHGRFRTLVEHWTHAMPERFLQIPYESLVSEPAAMARHVLAFCGLPYEAACIDIAGNRAPVSTASSAQVRHPIHRAGIGAWRRYAQPLAPLATLLAGAAAHAAQRPGAPA